jgi:prevent-host-death family protein
MEATVRELKAHLSEYLRRVAAGEEVVVTLRGKPMARLAPVSVAKTPEELEAEAIARLRTLPWVRAGAGGQVHGSDTPIPWPEGEKLLSELVLEDRK